MTRVFGGKEDKAFWSDKPIQPGHPKFKTNFIKKLFCKHNYKVFGGVFASTGYDLARCIKCGKYRNP